MLELVFPPLSIRPSLIFAKVPRPTPPAVNDTVAWFINRSLAVSTGALPWAVLHVVTMSELLWPVVPVLTVVSVTMIVAWAVAGVRVIAARARSERLIDLLGFILVVLLGFIMMLGSMCCGVF